jgi:threonine dehydratase
MAVGPPFTTIAEGLCARVPVEDTVKVLQSVLDDFLVVPETRLMDAARDLWDTRGIIAEPSGTAAAAALIDHADLGQHGVTALIVTGANASPDILRRVIDQP